jgi:anaphase-promoting complex subunit 10
MTIKEIALYMDYKLDESYTPKKISIRSGTTIHDLKEIHTQNIIEPSGWVTIPLSGLSPEVMKYLQCPFIL